MNDSNEQRDCHTISMASSSLTWKDVDIKIKHSAFRNRSQYIQYLVERDFEKTWDALDRLVPISLLVMMVMILVVVIIK